jgi:hypothetical protein
MVIDARSAIPLPILPLSTLPLSISEHHAFIRSIFGRRIFRRGVPARWSRVAIGRFAPRYVQPNGNGFSLVGGRP